MTSPRSSTDPTEFGPVYIGGLDRSGKTTMRAYLASHSNIAIPAVGSNMWPYFYRQYGDLADPENLDRCLDAMFRYKHVRFLDPDRARVEAEFATGPPTYARLFAILLEQFARREGKPRWGAQTGLIERYADEIFDAYPGVKFIHMLRDPRDRYEASLSRWPDGRGRAGGATARWRYSTRLAQRHVDRHPGRYLIVRFEDLVRATEETLQTVCRFIGEPWEPEMMSMSAAPELMGKLGITGGTVPRLSDEYIGLFRDRVPVDEVAFMQLHAGRVMDSFGYERVPIDWRAAEWLRFLTRAWPDQAARMIAWRTIEELQQRFPTLVRRRPGARMMAEPVRPSRS